MGERSLMGRISVLLIGKIAELFISMLMGFFLVKTKVMKSSDSNALSMVALYLVTPCVILNAFQVKYSNSI